jgi:hypothetical protein
VSDATTPTAAQLAITREFGSTSWAHLKQEVERPASRAVDTPAAPIIRPVASERALAAVFDAASRLALGLRAVEHAAPGSSMRPAPA